MSVSLLVTGGLVVSRLGGVVMVMPGLNAVGVPRLARLAVAIALTMLITPVVPQHQAVPTLPVLIVSLIGEIGLGVMIGGAVAMVFGGLVFATEVMGSQMGREMAAQFNPLLQMTQGSMGILAGLMATMVFLGLDLHLVVLTILANSFHALPPGSTIHLFEAAELWVQLAPLVIRYGLQLAGPVIAMVFLVNCFVAALTKLAPNMNVFFSIGMLMTMIAGTWLFFLMLPHMLDAHTAQVNAVIDFLPRLIESAGGDGG